MPGAMRSWWKKSFASRGKSGGRSPPRRRREKSRASRERAEPGSGSRTRWKNRGPNSEGFMKAAVLDKIGAPFRIDDLPVPKIAPDEVLVETRTCGICRTDIHIQDG